MTLKKFISVEKLLLEAFRIYVEEQQKLEPEIWPKDRDSGAWLEDFENFCSEKMEEKT